MKKFLMIALVFIVGAVVGCTTVGNAPKASSGQYPAWTAQTYLFKDPNGCQYWVFEDIKGGTSNVAMTSQPRMELYDARTVQQVCHK